MSALILINGCTAFEYKKYEQGAKETKELMDDVELAYKYRQVRYVDTPPIDAREIRRNERISWLDQSQDLRGNDTPLSILVDQIAQGVATPEYDFDIDPNKPVSILVRNGTKETSLKMLGLQANVFFQMTEDKIFVRRYVSETFSLPAIAGDMSYQIGSIGGSNSSNEDAKEGSISSTGGDDGQFSNVGYKGYNLTTQVSQGIQAIIKDPDGLDGQLIGSVSPVLGMSSIVVRTTPSLMETVKTFVDSTFASMSRDVTLDIQVIEWQLTEGSEFGVDGDITKLLGANGSLNIVASAPAISDSDGGGIGFTGAGDFDGTNALLKMMRTNGKAAITTEQKIQALNNKSQEVDLSDIRSYISRTATTFNTDDIEPTVEIDTASVRDGVKMLVIPSVHEDHVYLRLNGTLSKFLYFDDQQVSGVKVSQPRTRQSRFNVEGKFEYNKPIIVTQLKQVVEQSQSSQTAEVIPGNMGERRIINTIVMLTPRKDMERSTIENFN